MDINLGRALSILLQSAVQMFLLGIESFAKEAIIFSFWQRKLG